MNELLYLLVGAVLLVLIVYDFFFTTLSGSGAGFISALIAINTYRISNFLVRFFGRGIYRFSGLMVNLMVLAVWMFIVWIGLFLVYSYNPDVITSSDGRIADIWERLYFTGYTLSTLGMGDFTPTTASFQIITSFFSFFGFIFFTSSMTYFLSVSSALINKRTLARSIRNLGDSPVVIAENLLRLDTSYAYQQVHSLQEMVDRHAVNHEAYPVIHYYTQSAPALCLSLNIARLDEAISILLTKDTEDKLPHVLGPLRSSLTHFLMYLDRNYPGSPPQHEDPITILTYEINKREEEDLQKRRKILGGFLRSERLDWEHVT